MSWRNILAKYLQNGGSGTVFEFGVFTGKSVYDIANAYAFAGVRLQRVLGFDSFCGLPKETAEAIGQDVWEMGAFCGMEYFNAVTIPETVEKTANFIRGGLPQYTGLDLIPGFYCDSLTDELPAKLEIKPADYIDIDVDLYSSAKDCLDWIFRTGLARAGTLIGYDDWGGTPGWEQSLDGESRAHKEMCEKYGVQCRLLELIGPGYPHVASLFVVERIN